jgi:S-adenosylmethionine decarboxylase proenzyme
MEGSAPPTLYSADLTGCTGLAALSRDDITGAFRAALCQAGATVVDGMAHDFPGAGLTCVFILSESHAVLHTWPETGTVNVDLFSCSTRLKSWQAIDELTRCFGAEHVAVQEIARADGHGALSLGRR